MSISPDIIDTIKQSASIEEVIGDFVSLKKKGHYYLGCCPFHDEKTPSFTVTPTKGIYKCFGCGKAGDSIQFLMDLEGLNYPEALKYLASKYGIEIEESATPEEIARQTEKESLLIVLSYAAQYYEDLLWNSDEGKSIGLSYFRERGFNHETIRKFGLGFSRETWDGLTKSAQEKGYSKEFLLKAGLSLENAENTSLYDRFRGRVIFPIHNLTGKTIAFGARILKSDKKQPKYLNSPETEVYHKSKVLYGLYQAKQAIRHDDNCFLVEGYTDVISLHQGGIHNVVSSSGTSLTEDQIKLIHRYTNNITVLYDGDVAGLKASMRGIDLILAQGLDVKVVTFPDGEDPDSYARKIGGEAFKEYVGANARDFITYKTELTLREAGNDPIKKASVIRDIVESIAKIPDSIKRTVFFQQCSQLLHIDENILIAEYNKIQLKERRKDEDARAWPFMEELPVAPSDEKSSIKKDLYASAVEMQEKEIIRLLLKFGNEQFDTTNFASYVLSEIDDLVFTIPKYRDLLELIREDFNELGVIREQKFFSHPDEETRSEAIALITSRYSISEKWTKYEIFVPTDEEILPNLGFLTILRLKFRSIKYMVQENMLEIKKAEAENKDIMTLLQVHKQLKEAEKELASVLGIVIS